MKPKIIIAGGSGFIGNEMANYFKNRFEIVILTRNKTENINGIHFINWDGKTFGNWTNELENAIAIINLTGRSVNCRYSEFNKNEIYESRLAGTNIIGKAIINCKNKPKIWINAASATIYRNEYEQPNTEEKGIIGEGFSVDVCKKWEQMFYSFKIDNVRQINLRIAIVLQKDKSVMIPFKNLAKLGLGGKAATGKQLFSWIHIMDFCKAIDFLIHKNNAVGTYNLAAPNAITNSYFMNTIRTKMGIPFGIPQPKWLLEIGAWIIKTETELIVKSRWVYPARLLNEGFKFEYNTIDKAIIDLV
ncbi:MAG: TIGR01777 family oxidoreductase [Bacteroidia bacterium]